ncbi:MAG: DUF1847 domain-containing protein [Desulfovibrio sp.]
MSDQRKQSAGCVCPMDCATLCAPERTPASCPGKQAEAVMVRAREEYLRAGSTARRHWLAFARLVGHGGASRSRLEHIMEFSRSAGFRRIGLAGCARYLPLMHATKKILAGFGFESVCFSCKVGGNKFADIAIARDSDWTLCNPLGQALLLNDWGADLNVAFGLCMGHDLIFQQYSTAPVTTLVVKEKISDDNPTATLRRMADGGHCCAPYFPEE